MIASKVLQNFRFAVVAAGVTAGVAAAPAQASPPHDPVSARSLCEAQTLGVQLVEVPEIRSEVRYATENNFMGVKLYSQAKMVVRAELAEKLERINRKLSAQGYALLLLDGYRPWSVTRILWERTPEPLRHFVADPAQGSMHNRGAAVDVTLWDLRLNREVEMPSAFDELTERAHRNFTGGSERTRMARDRLIQAMESGGLRGIEEEWWHFEDPSLQAAPVLDIDLSEL